MWVDVPPLPHSREKSKKAQYELNRVKNVANKIGTLKENLPTKSVNSEHREMSLAISSYSKSF